MGQEHAPASRHVADLVVQRKAKVVMSLKRPTESEALWIHHQKSQIPELYGIIREWKIRL